MLLSELCLDPDYEGTMILQNALPSDTCSQPRIFHSLATPLLEPQTALFISGFSLQITVLISGLHYLF